MRYCPNCEAEYLDDVDRCADCRVELVDEPVEIEEPPGLFDRLSSAIALRILLGVLSAAAIVYAAIGLVTAFMYLLVDQGSSENFFQLIQKLNEAQTGAFRVGLACIAVIAGAVLLKRYEDPRPTPPRSPSTVMRTLFWTVVIFSVLWAATGVMTSRLQAEQTYRPAQFIENEENAPSDWELTLITLHYAAYVVGTAAFGILAALFLARPMIKSAPVDVDLGQLEGP